MKRLKLLTCLMAIMILVVPSAAVFAAAPAAAEDVYTFDGVDYINVGSRTFESNPAGYRMEMLNNPVGINGAVPTVCSNEYSSYSVSDMWTWFSIKALQGAMYTRTDRDQANIFANFGKSITSYNYFEKLYTTPYSQLTNFYNLTDYYGNETGILSKHEDLELFGDKKLSGLEQGDNYRVFRDKLRSASNATTLHNRVAKSAVMAYCQEDLDYKIKDYNLHVKVGESTGLEDGPVYFTQLGIAGEDLEDYSKHDELEDYDYHSLVVAFNNFTVTPIIPDGGDNSNNTYVVETTEDAAPTKKIVSTDLKNMSGEKVTVSQNISESQTTTMTSNVSGSKSHSVSKTVKIGFKITPIKDVFDFSGEASKTWGDTVTSGWSESKSTSTTSSESNTVSITLPAYTTVLMSQERKNTTTQLRYNCPVALNFDVHLFYVYGDYDEDDNETTIFFDHFGKFGGSANGREDFANRYAEGTGTAETADKDGVDWGRVKSWCGSGLLNRIAKNVPFDVTDASFSLDTDLYQNDVYDILPIYPIDSIKPVNPDSVLTAQKWKYEYTMMEGDSKYSSDIGLKALNKFGSDFYTFYQKNGYYEVYNENNEKDESVVKIVSDPSGTKFVAVGEGVAYLKYNINEDTYRTADMVLSDTYIKNTDDFTHAVIKINVTAKHVHEFSKPQFGWSDDNKCTAYRKCSCGVEESETVDGKIIEDTDASCTEKGKTVYRATFENEAFENAENKPDKTVEKEALGHDWGKWVKKDEKTHSRSCSRCTLEESANHQFDDGAVVQDDSTNGKMMMEYTCTDCGYSYREEAPVQWLAPTYTWSDDNKQCVAKRVGKFNSDYKEEETSDALVDVKSTRTCTVDGVTTYTATFKNDAFETQVKTVEEKAEGHKWDSGVVTKTATATSNGEITYTCTVCGEKKKVVTPVVANVWAKMMASGKNAQVISWLKVKGADGYNIYMATCNSQESYGSCRLVKTIMGNNTFKLTKKGLKKKTAYKSYVEAFKIIGDKQVPIGKSPLMHSITGNYTKKYANVKKIITKKPKITLKKGKKYKLSKTLKLKLYKNKRKPLDSSHSPKYRYVSSDPSIVKVSAAGNIKGLKAGECKIYIMAVNGVRSKVVVKVK